jgi:hypothetical protein
MAEVADHCPHHTEDDSRCQPCEFKPVVDHNALFLATPPQFDCPCVMDFDGESICTCPTRERVCRDSKVTGEPSIFEVKEEGKRTVIGFRDWSSLRNRLFSPDQPTFFNQVETELSGLMAEYQCEVLAIDMTPVDFVPTLFLAVLIGIRKSGTTMELLQPSTTVRETLERTKLNQLVVLRD